MKRLCAVILSAAIVAAGGAAMAQDKFPTKPIRVINPYAPGGAVDIVARIVTEPMRESLGQPLVLENRPGGFGMIAGQDLMRQPADGYTLWFGNVNTHAIWPVMHKKKYPFDFSKEIIPIALVADVPSLLVVTTRDFAPKTFQEFIDHAKANPGKVRYTSTGVGSFPHIDMALLARRAGVDMLHIPNREGAAGMMKDLSTADVHAAVVNVATSTPLIKSGQLRPLAVVTKERLAEFPDVPTLTELGYPEVGTAQWLGMFARAGTPDAVVAQLHKAALDAVARPATRDLLNKQVMRPFTHATPEEGKAWLAAELDRWQKVLDELDLKME